MGQDGVGRGVEGLAKGFGTRRQRVLSDCSGSLPAPCHSGHGNENSQKVRITVIQCFGAWPGHARTQSESWIILHYISIRGKASLRILSFDIQVFHEKDSWGRNDLFPFLDDSCPESANGEFVGLMEELDLMAMECEICCSQQLKLMAKGCIRPCTGFLWPAQCWPRI